MINFTLMKPNCADYRWRPTIHSVSSSTGRTDNRRTALGTSESAQANTPSLTVEVRMIDRNVSLLRKWKLISLRLYKRYTGTQHVLTRQLTKPSRKLQVRDFQQLYSEVSRSQLIIAGGIVSKLLWNQTSRLRSQNNNVALEKPWRLFKAK